MFKTISLAHDCCTCVIQRKMPDSLQLHLQHSCFMLQHTLCMQRCFSWKNQPIKCPKSEWCHYLYTFCNFTAWYQLTWRLGTLVLKEHQHFLLW